MNTPHDISLDPAPLLRRRYNIVVEIKASEVLEGASYRWLYDVQPVIVGGDAPEPTFADRGSEIKAINVREFGNTTSSVAGQDPDDLPDGFDFGAVQGYVSCWGGSRYALTSGAVPEPVLLFSASNPVEGSC